MISSANRLWRRCPCREGVMHLLLLPFDPPTVLWLLDLIDSGEAAQ